MSSGTTNLGVVFIHGLFSSEKTWDTFAGLIESDEELTSVTVTRFTYASPKIRRFRPDRRTPDYNDLAERLKTFLHFEASEYDRLVLVAHSQGGLIVQRYLARMLNDGQGEALTKIQGVVLFACPNDGSDFVRPLRNAWWRSNPQVRALAPLDSEVKDAQRTVLRQVVEAPEVGPAMCPIPFWVFGGIEDNVVVRASAQGVFPRVFMLPGDHFSIIEPDSHKAPAYLALRERLLDTQLHVVAADPATSAPACLPVIASAPEPWGDKTKAARILEVLPPYADWLKTLRTQQFFVVSGRVNRLIHEAADALRNDPLGFIDLELKQAAAAFSQAAVQLSEEMINLLFADKAETDAYERLSAQEKEDAWRFVVGEHQPGEDERRLHTLRNDFFETYDVLVCLLNERLLAPEQTAAPTAPDTSASVAESVAVPDTVGPQPRVGQGLPLHEHDLLGAHYQLRSAGLGQPTTEAYLHRVTAVQHFAAREGSGPGWVLTLRKGRAIAVSEPLWRALLAAGHPAENGDPLAAVGYPTAAGTDSVVLGSDIERFALEGGDWGPGCLVRTNRDWRWEPQEDVGFNQTPSARNWMALQPPPQLRVRAVVTLPWDQAGELEITPARRRELAQALPISRFAGAVTMLSLRRGADLPASAWQLGPHRNASDSLSYSATITTEGDRPVLAGAVMVALPGALQSHTVTCAEVTIQDAAAWAAVLPSGSSTKLTLEEVEAVLLAAWETAADLLPAVVCDETTMRWAGAPTVELRLSAEGPHDQPRVGLGTLIDVRALGRTDRSSLSEMAVTIKGSPMLETTERQGRLRRALVHMVQRFGYVEADDHLFG